MAFQPTQAPISPPRLGNILETSHLCSLCGFVVLEGAEQTLFSKNGGFFYPVWWLREGQEQRACLYFIELRTLPGQSRSYPGRFAKNV